MGLQEIKNRLNNLGLGIKTRHLLRSGRQLINISIKEGAVDKRAINLFLKDPNVLEIFELDNQSNEYAELLVSNLPETTDMGFINNLLDQNETLRNLKIRSREAKRKLSMAQLGALLQLQGEQIEKRLKEANL